MIQQMSERALFVSVDKAAAVAQRLRFIKRDVRWRPYSKRGELMGYTVLYLDSAGWNVLCESEINKFGLE